MYNAPKGYSNFLVNFIRFVINKTFMQDMFCSTDRGSK